MGLKTILGLKRKPTAQSGVKLRDAARDLILNGRPYQPILDIKPASRGRVHDAFEERWKLISAVIERTGARSYCDIGCAEGYYLSRAAKEHGLFAIGVDRKEARLQYTTAAALLQGLSFGILKLEITPDSVEALPAVDLISCMSVMHHIVNLQGIDAARSILGTISRKAAKGFIFDIGRCDAVHVGSDPDADTIEFLKSGGFTSVELLGRASTEVDVKDRPLFLASCV